MSFVPELLRVTSDLRLALYGLVLVLAMLFFPQGFGGYLSSRAKFAARKAYTQAFRRQGSPVTR
jgi:hypothetical protein